MVIGVCKIDLLIDGASSLKDKRHIIKSITARLRSKFNVSVAEVGLNDIWKNSIIGIACVSNEVSHANSILSNVVNFIEKDRRVQIVDYSVEIL